MNEIVRKLRESNARMTFESVAVDTPEDEDIERSEEDIAIESEEVITDPEDMDKDSEALSEDTSTMKCECGSSNVIEEDGNLVCDDCGRSVRKEDITEDAPVDKKPAALRKALEWWHAGHYQKAVELYKKYGVTDAEFARALVNTIRESEEGLDLDADDLDESLDMSVATPYVESDGEESLRILINGVEYRYRSNNMSVSDLLRKFMGIYKHSLGAALQWLKKNSYIYFNGRTKKFVEVKSTIREGRSPVRNIADKVLRNHGLNNSVGKYDRFVNTMYNRYKETLLSPEELEKKLEIEFRRMYPGIKESAEIQTVEEEESNMDKNIIRALQTPVSTATKPNLDAAIMEAVATDSVYSESALISYLKSSKDFPVYIRTTKVKGGWDDVQFAAGRAGCRVSRVHDNSILKKFNLPGNFAEFYVFNKK